MQDGVGEGMEQDHRAARLARDREKRRMQKMEKEMRTSWLYRNKLHAAAMKGDDNLARTMLAKDSSAGMNLNKVFVDQTWVEDGQSPLFFAAIKGQLKMVQTLIDAGANVDLKNYDGRTPLSLAAEYGKHETCTLLIDNQADVNSKDTRGRTPLHIAVQKNHARTVRVLLERNADPCACTRTQSWTPLHLAATTTGCDIKIVCMLLGGPSYPLDNEEMEAKEDRGMTMARLLEDETAWSNQVEQLISNSTRNGNARTRLQHVYPSDWLYDDVGQLYRLCMQRFPALPLPPYLSDLSIKSAMGCTPLDEVSRADGMRSL
ncbi:hypothetical protein GUITHDRAFT_161714 [Guillardia theta CCMP2712]|uniref:Uncharacterized protein n=1 Tax=Guillardia theta (strain CCMP2712) TaxID=905079 RepID=L1JR88_GUITC|nr:hypothetical protein GUITHDRAFT_161714 [Guillardia theta CCMP2712]EKX50779.1 hypothetical protein GUITHDRAFT_161714 [Guillardia theta CCMP2712]|eukprot:XP_005837759.1 hypothetical protein GUITHDRAFT_161714 [Guillardia theta CCMP2712]